MTHGSMWRRRAGFGLLAVALLGASIGGTVAVMSWAPWEGSSVPQVVDATPAAKRLTATEAAAALKAARREIGAASYLIECEGKERSGDGWIVECARIEQWPPGQTTRIEQWHIYRVSDASKVTRLDY